MSTKKQGSKILADVTQLVEGLHSILEECGVNNVTNALHVVKTLRSNVGELYQQNAAMMTALECDNWKNAVARAQSLMKKGGSQIDLPTHGRPLVRGGSGVKSENRD